MNQFSGKLTLPYLLQQGMQRRLWQGKFIDVRLISASSAIIVSSAGLELFDFNNQNTIWEIDCPIQSVVINYDSKLLLTFWQHKSYIWDLDRGEFLHQFKQSSPDRYITSNIIFLPNSKTIAFTELSTGLIFYDLVSRKYTIKIAESKNIEHIVFSRDRKLVAFLFEDNVIVVHNLSSGNPIQALKIKREDITENFNLLFTPDSQYLIYARGKNQNVYIYEIRSGNQIQVLENYTDNVDNVKVGFHSEKIVTTFSDDGTLFAIGNSNGKIRIWNFNNQEYIDTINISAFKHLLSIDAISFSPDNNYLVSANSNNTVELWKIESNQKITERKYPSHFCRPIVSSNLKFHATIDRKQITLYNFNSGKQIKKIEGNEYYKNVSINSKGTKILATLDTDVVRVWNIEDETQIFSLTEQSYINAIIHPNDRLIAVINKEYTKAEIWDIQSNHSV